MAKAAEMSTRGYFRMQYQKHPEWLQETNNDKIYEQWRKDNPDKEITDSIKGNQANLKSTMRQAAGLGGRRQKRRGKRSAEAVAVVGMNRPTMRISAAALENLETMLDGCLALARQHEASGLEAVVKHLRLARNGVVVQQG